MTPHTHLLLWKADDSRVRNNPTVSSPPATPFPESLGPESEGRAQKSTRAQIICYENHRTIPWNSLINQRPSEELRPGNSDDFPPNPAAFRTV